MTQFEAHDLNNNSLMDSIFWVVPHLSNQTYQLIIEISKAEHLDSNRTFISDIYESVKVLDGNYSEVINDGEFVRVTFEIPLDSSRDITIYPRGNGSVEVYEKDGEELIASFGEVVEGENKVYLTNLNTTQNIFDLKINSLEGLEFDYIVDPYGGPALTSVILNSTNPTTNDTFQNLTLWTDQDGNASLHIVRDWKKEGTSIALVNYAFDFNNSAGTDKAKDYSDNSLNLTKGTLTSWSSTGFMGGSYYFGSNTNTNVRLYTAGSSVLKVYNFTIEAMVYPSLGSFILASDYKYGTACGSDFGGWGLNRGEFRYCSSNNTNIRINYVDLTLNKWTHVVVTFNDTDVYVYKNGVVDNITSSEGLSYLNDAPALYIGSQAGFGNPLLGYIDEVRMYNFSMSPEQVSALKNNRTYIIVSQEISKGETWSACVTPTDLDGEGAEVCSNELLVRSAVPIHTAPILNSTNILTNDTYQNLTVYNQSTFDIDGDSITNILNWKKNGVSLARLILPFDSDDSAGAGATKDYSDNSKNFTVGSAVVWNATGGHDGAGAYEFNGVDTNENSMIYYTTQSSFGFSGTQNMTFSMWINAKSLPSTSKGLVESDTNWLVYLNNSNTLIVALADSVDNAYHNVVGCNTPLISSTNTWYNVVANVWDPTSATTGITIYVNGVECSSYHRVRTHSGWTNTGTAGIGIGGRYLTGFIGDAPFNGTIDNFKIWNYSLSKEQVSALYNNRTDLIVSQETSVGQNWTACITPNDGYNDGEELCSNNVEILANFIPNATNVILNSTDVTLNDTFQNLTGYWTFSDIGSYLEVLNETRWYNNSVEEVSLKNFTIVDSGNTTYGDIWIFGVRVFDGIDWSDWVNSSELIIGSSHPAHTTPILNSSDGTNNTNSNLTVYNQSTSDAEGDFVKNIINWKKEGNSITKIFLPFEGGSNNASTKDYSDNSYPTAVYDVHWNSTGGYDSHGGYDFDGIGDYILTDLVTINGDNYFNESFTLVAWFKRNTGEEVGAFLSGQRSSNYYNFNLGFMGPDKWFINEPGQLVFVHYDEFATPVIRSIKGPVIPENEFHLVAIIGNETGYTMYVDDNTTSYSNTGEYNLTSSLWNLVTGKSAGAGFNSWGFFNGSVDEVIYYPEILSQEQIAEIYNNGYDTIVSQETSVGQNWTACVTPNDGYNDGEELCSNNVEILSANVAPTATNVILNSTDVNLNDTFQNLTGYWIFSDDDVEDVEVLNETRWYNNS
ncbi:MAG: laminin G domain-containing protein, partial [DPANN group archaeon]|nr:laminin G domain-containing protein [DPANN group archaeon]